MSNIKVIAQLKNVLSPCWYTASVQTVHYAYLRRVCLIVLGTKPDLQQYRSLGQHASIPHPPSGQGEIPTKRRSWVTKLGSKCDSKISTTFCPWHCPVQFNKVCMHPWPRTAVWSNKADDVLVSSPKLGWWLKWIPMEGSCIACAQSAWGEVMLIENMLSPFWYTASVQTVHYAYLRRVCSIVLGTKPDLQQYRSLGQHADIPHLPSEQGEIPTKGGSWVTKLGSKCDSKISTTFCLWHCLVQFGLVCMHPWPRTAVVSNKADDVLVGSPKVGWWLKRIPMEGSCITCAQSAQGEVIDQCYLTHHRTVLPSLLAVEASSQ